MKRLVDLITVGILLLGFLCPIYGQFTKTTNNFLIWSSTGLSTMKNDAIYRHSSSNLGTSLGIGYELNLHQFFLQPGIELTYYSSQMNLRDTSYVLPMIDTESMLFNGNFYFKNTIDYIKTANIGIPLIFGFKIANRYFFAAGGKLLFNLSETSITKTTVTMTATYDSLIGDNNDGVLSNMPNHSLATNNRAVSGKMKLNTMYLGSIEFGYTFDNYEEMYRFRKKPVFRVSLLCDYGIVPVTQRDESIFVNISDTQEYVPAIRSYLLNDINSPNLTISYIGIKFSVLFGKTHSKCSCQMDK